MPYASTDYVFSDGLSELLFHRGSTASDDWVQRIDNPCVIMLVDNYPPSYPEILAEQSMFLAGVAADDIHRVYDIVQRPWSL